MGDFYNLDTFVKVLQSPLLDKSKNGSLSKELLLIYPEMLWI